MTIGKSGWPPDVWCDLFETQRPCLRFIHSQIRPAAQARPTLDYPAYRGNRLSNVFLAVKPVDAGNELLLSQIRTRATFDGKLYGAEFLIAF